MAAKSPSSKPPKVRTRDEVQRTVAEVLMQSQKQLGASFLSAEVENGVNSVTLRIKVKGVAATRKQLRIYSKVPWVRGLGTYGRGRGLFAMHATFWLYDVAPRNSEGIPIP